MARENAKDSAKAKQLSAGRNLNRAAKLVYSFHFCPHCHKNYLVYWLFFCCQLFFSDKQSSKRFTCTHNPIFQPCHLCHFQFRLPRHFGNVWSCGFCCRACSLCYSLPSPLKFVSAPYFSSSNTYKFSILKLKYPRRSYRFYKIQITVFCPQEQKRCAFS